MEFPLLSLGKLQIYISLKIDKRLSLIHKFQGLMRLIKQSWHPIFLPIYLDLDYYPSDKYLVVVLQILGNSCSCYKKNFITKLWALCLTLSIYTCFSGNCL